MKLYVSGPLSHSSGISTLIDIQREELSNGGPERDTLVGHVEKHAGEVLENQINDSGKDGHTPAGERASLGALYDNIRCERGGLVENGRTNASIEVAIENIVDCAGRATHNKCGNQELEHFSPEGLQVQARVVRRHGQAPG